MLNPNKFIKVVTPLALAIALTACGGGASLGVSDELAKPEEVKKISSIQLSASSRLLGSAGSAPVILTAIAKNTDNNSVSNAGIIFIVDNGGTITPEIAGTGSIQTAALTPGEPKNRILKVTAKVGAVSQTIDIEVIGTEVVIDGPEAITFNTEAQFVLKLKDSDNKPINRKDVVLSSALGNIIKTDSFETDANGEIAFTLGATSSGVDTITANVLGVTSAKKVTVTADEFVLSGSTQDIVINTTETINFVWKKDGVGVGGEDILIGSTRGIVSPPIVTTDGVGKGSFTITSPTAGETVITATSSDGLSTSMTREFVAITPAYLNTQAEPALVLPNGSSTIIAKITDANNNPVKNKTVTFNLDDDVNGTLSATTAVTDSLGRASVSYTAGNSSSAKDGVVITTNVQGYPAVAEDIVLLTVGGEATRIVLGHDHLIKTRDVFYIKQFGVIVTDSAGQPVKGQEVSFSITPTHYYKGQMYQVDTDGDLKADAWAQGGLGLSPLDPATKCISEDFNGNNQLDAGEDINGDDSLWPTHDATVTNSGVTDEQGTIVIEVIYPKSRALWSTQKITASIRSVGTEFEENTITDLPMLAKDAQDIKIDVPNHYSPYGQAANCSTPD